MNSSDPATLSDPTIEKVTPSPSERAKRTPKESFKPVLKAQKPKGGKAKVANAGKPARATKGKAIQNKTGASPTPKTKPLETVPVKVGEAPKCRKDTMVSPKPVVIPTTGLPAVAAKPDFQVDMSKEKTYKSFVEWAENQPVPIASKGPQHKLLADLCAKHSIPYIPTSHSSPNGHAASAVFRLKSHYSMLSKIKSPPGDYKFPKDVKVLSYYGTDREAYWNGKALKGLPADHSLQVDLFGPKKWAGDSYTGNNRVTEPKLASYHSVMIFDVYYGEDGTIQEEGHWTPSSLNALRRFLIPGYEDNLFIGCRLFPNAVGCDAPFTDTDGVEHIEGVYKADENGMVTFSADVGNDIDQAHMTWKNPSMRWLLRSPNYWRQGKNAVSWRELKTIGCFNTYVVTDAKDETAVHSQREPAVVRYHTLRQTMWVRVLAFFLQYARLTTFLEWIHCPIPKPQVLLVHFTVVADLSSAMALETHSNNVVQSMSVKVKAAIEKFPWHSRVGRIWPEFVTRMIEDTTVYMLYHHRVQFRKKIQKARDITYGADQATREIATEKFSGPYIRLLKQVSYAVSVWSFITFWIAAIVAASLTWGAMHASYSIGTVRSGSCTWANVWHGEQSWYRTYTTEGTYVTFLGPTTCTYADVLSDAFTSDYNREAAFIDKVHRMYLSRRIGIVWLDRVASYLYPPDYSTGYGWKHWLSVNLLTSRFGYLFAFCGVEIPKTVSPRIYTPLEKIPFAYQYLMETYWDSILRHWHYSLIWFLLPAILKLIHFRRLFMGLVLMGAFCSVAKADAYQDFSRAHINLEPYDEIGTCYPDRMFLSRVDCHLPAIDWDLTGRLEIFIEGIKMTIHQALAILPTMDPMDKPLHPFFLTNGALWGVHRSARNFLIALATRMHKDSHTNCAKASDRAAAWTRMADIVCNLLGPRDSEPKSLARCIEKYSPAKAAAFIKGTEEVLQDSHIRINKNVFVKSNETIGTKEFIVANATHKGIKPRSIVCFDSANLAELTPWSLALSEILHDFANGDIVIIDNIPVHLHFCSGYSAEQLDNMVNELQPNEGLICVNGDDSLIYHPNWGWFESDFTQYDQSQDEHMFDNFTEKVMKHCGLPIEIVQRFISSCKEKYCTRPIQGVSAKGNPGCQLPTGSAFTTVSNSFTTLGFYLYCFVEHESPCTAAFLLGLTIKPIYRDSFSQATFLKGWWVGNLGSAKWVPLPSSVLKLGKTETPPELIFNRLKMSYTEQINTLAAAVAKSNGRIDRDYPILGAFLQVMDRYVSQSENENVTRCLRSVSDSLSERSSNGGTRSLNRRDAVAMIVERYDITEQMINDCEVAILSATKIPAFVSHPVFTRMRLVDYEC